MISLKLKHLEVYAKLIHIHSLKLMLVGPEVGRKEE